MANADAAFGFRPIGNLDGSPYNGGTIRCALLAADETATFIGDAVKLSGTAADDGSPSVAQLAVDERAFGVITSFEANTSDLGNQFRAAGADTVRFCQVVPALDNLFVVQCVGDYDLTDTGDIGDITVGSGSTVTGFSAMEMETAIGNGAQLYVLGLSREPNNAVGANANIIVRFNESALRGLGEAT